MNQSKSNPFWRSVDIRQFWWGQLAAAVGARVTREGLPIVAIVAASATASQVGIMAALATLPALVLGNLLGQWVDSHKKRPLLVGASLIRTVLLSLIPVLYLLHRLSFPILALITALTAATGVLQAISRHAYLPFLVSRKHLETGHHLVETAESVGETVGPGLMGLLIKSIGAPFAMLFDAFANIIAAFFFALVSKQEARAVKRPASPSPLPQTWYVWKQIARHPALNPLWYNAGASSFFGGFFSALYEFYVLKTLSLSPLWLGILITLGGLGSLVGTGLYKPLRKYLSLTQVIFWGYLAYALFNTAVPLAHGALWESFLFLFAAQFGGDLFATISQISAFTLEQEVTPDPWLGQVRGSFEALSGGLEVAGALVSGTLAVFIPIQSIMAIAVAGLIGATLFLANKSLLHFPKDGTRWTSSYWL